MPSIAEILKRHKDFSQEKLSKMFKDKLKATHYSRVFNGFPPVLPEEVMRQFIDEMVNIINNTKFMHEEGKPMINYNDVETVSAFIKWYEKLTAAGCFYLLDSNGKPSKELMDFLELDAEERKLLSKDENVNFLMSSYAELMWEFVGPEYLKRATAANSTKDMATLADPYVATSNYSQSFNTDYFGERVKMYVELHEALHKEISAFKSALIPTRAALMRALHPQMISSENKKNDESDVLQTSLLAINKLIGLLDQYLLGFISPNELVCLLESTPQTSQFNAKFKAAGLTFFKKGSKEPLQLNELIKTVTNLVREFDATAETPPPSPKHQSKPK